MRPARLLILCRSSCLLLLLGAAAVLFAPLTIAAAQDAAANDDGPKLNLDPNIVRDAIAGLLRDRAGAGGGDGGEDNGGYAEAAQEYLEHIQSALAAVKTPTEVYIREQLADLETLDGLLTSLEAAAGQPLKPSAAGRLVGQLVKGPARQLLLSQAATGYADSELSRRVTDATGELRRFLADVGEQGVADSLRRHSASLPAGPTRDYLDGVLDRLLELDGKKAKFTVSIGADGQSTVTRVPDDGDKEDGDRSSSSADADGADGRGLFDQVLRRLAAASVAERLGRGAAAAAAAIARVGELRSRRYRPAGLDIILETIEQCLDQPR